MKKPVLFGSQRLVEQAGSDKVFAILCRVSHKPVFIKFITALMRMATGKFYWKIQVLDINKLIAVC